MRWLFQELSLLALLDCSNYFGDRTMIESEIKRKEIDLVLSTNHSATRKIISLLTELLP